MPDITVPEVAKETSVKAPAPVAPKAPLPGTERVVAAVAQAPAGGEMQALAQERVDHSAERASLMTQPVSERVLKPWLDTNARAPQMSTCIDGVTAGIMLPAILGGEITWQDFLASRLYPDQLAETKEGMTKGHVAHLEEPLLPVDSPVEHPNPHEYRVTDEDLQDLWGGAKISTAFLTAHFAEWAQHQSKGALVLPPLTRDMPNLFDGANDQFDMEKYLLANAKRLDVFTNHPAAKPYLDLLFRLTMRTFTAVDPRPGGNPEATRLAGLQRDKYNFRKQPVAEGEDSRESFKRTLQGIFQEEAARFAATYPDIPLPTNLGSMYLANFIEGEPAYPALTYAA